MATGEPATPDPVPPRIFISYSRKDGRFVDRLAADLFAANVSAWVDRVRLEGGQNWEALIEEAIESAQCVVVVLSPDALASRWVEREYQLALSADKRIIPLQLRQILAIPEPLAGFQVIDFVHAYTFAFNRLLKALMAPPAMPQGALPSVFLRTRYEQGLAARASGNLYRAKELWREALDADPWYLNGDLAREFRLLHMRLDPIRAQQLRQEAQAARKAHQWRREAGAWEALLALVPFDYEGRICLREARRNRRYDPQYEIAQDAVARGDIASAQAALKALWRTHPNYGDPAGLASEVNVPLPESTSRADEKLRRRWLIKETLQTSQLALSLAAVGMYALLILLFLLFARFQLGSYLPAAVRSVLDWRVASEPMETWTALVVSGLFLYYVGRAFGKALQYGHLLIAFAAAFVASFALVPQLPSYISEASLHIGVANGFTDHLPENLQAPLGIPLDQGLAFAVFVLLGDLMGALILAAPFVIAQRIATALALHADALANQARRAGLLSWEDALRSNLIGNVARRMGLLTSMYREARVSHNASPTPKEAPGSWTGSLVILTPALTGLTLGIVGLFTNSGFISAFVAGAVAVIFATLNIKRLRTIGGWLAPLWISYGGVLLMSLAFAIGLFPQEPQAALLSHCIAIMAGLTVAMLIGIGLVVTERLRRLPVTDLRSDAI